MESDRPMDRLVCGDVGFGKTEVAIRAAFKAVDNSKQVAVLVDNYYVDYVLPYPGSVRPGDIMWYIKATRDRLWLMVTPDSGKKADLYQLFSDKRLVMAYELFAEHEPELGFSTLTKAEKYMLQASQLEEKMRKSGVDTRELSERLMKASIVHTLVIDKIKLMAPEDAIAELNIVQEFPRGLFDRKKIVFEEKGMTPPENPLNRI